MPILDVEIVTRPGETWKHELSAKLAHRAGEVFNAPPGTVWVKVRTIDGEHYAENDDDTSEKLFPVIVSVLKARFPDRDQMESEVKALTAAIADVCGRPEENVHILYQPEGRGRVSFGGRIVSGE